MLGTCIVVAVKYNEEVCHFNSRGLRFYKDSEFSVAVSIPTKKLMQYQLHLLKTIDHNLFISEDEYTTFVRRICDMVKSIRENQAIQTLVG